MVRRTGLRLRAASSGIGLHDELTSEAYAVIDGVDGRVHYIRFPDRDTMQRIVDVHFPGLKKALLAEALEVFFGLRDVPGLKKKPSTSELLDWLKLLLAEDIAPEALRSQDKKMFIPPLHGALLKNEQDVHLFERVVFMSRAGR